ncbi:MAG TPA: DUF5946 family protein [Candidatus Polarisedimenticolaceae bacterium]|nr:DUF5946 family protein [Candidatus Polarisedimenticolaceae bacterium]
MTTTCPGCGLTRPVSGAVYDRKFHASAECWAVFEEVLAVEFQDATIFGRAHQITVDTYAVQHAGGRHPDKSVCVHLIGLHTAIERGVTPGEIAPRLQRFVSKIATWPHFDIPERRAKLTVADVALALGEPGAHVEKVKAWGREVWDCWAPHHAAVRALAVGL